MIKERVSKSPDERGYYGTFGGAFIPEMLYPNVEELRRRYLEIMHEAGFQKEYQGLLRDYVGRPSPLYLAERLSAKHNAPIYLKREDLNHTGAHKINNTIGQIRRARRLVKRPEMGEAARGQHVGAPRTVGGPTGVQ